jgi:arylsulfatase A-like enzyme
MDGQNYYWSKSYPSGPSFTDFMYADAQCFEKYDGTDADTYSSTLYGDKAVRVILEHDYAASPMFLYFSAQAVHDPFVDAVRFPEGNQQVYASYDTWASDSLSEESFGGILDKIDASGRRMYVTALSLLDGAVRAIHESLRQVGQLDNTYIVVASDNGGCFKAGAKNGPLRGTKGSLFEGEPISCFFCVC